MSQATIISMPNVIGAEWADEDGLQVQLYVTLPNAERLYLAWRRLNDVRWSRPLRVDSPERFGFVSGRRPRKAEMANIAQTFRQARSPQATKEETK